MATLRRGDCLAAFSDGICNVCFLLQGHDTAVAGNGGGGGAASTGFRVGGGGYATSGGGDEPRRKRQDENKPNHVLLFTIINPMYPITVVSEAFFLIFDGDSCELFYVTVVAPGT